MKKLFLLGSLFVLPFFCISQKKLPIGGIISIFQSIDVSYCENTYNITFSYSEFAEDYLIECITEGDLLYINEGKECFSYEVIQIYYMYDSIINVDVESLNNAKRFPIGMGILVRSDKIKTVTLYDLPFIISKELYCFLLEYF